MSDMLQIITHLRKDLKKLESQGKALAVINEKLNNSSDLTQTFEDLWVGGWGQKSYNHYRNPRNHQEGIQVNADYFYDIVRRKNGLDLDDIEKAIVKNLQPYKKFQQHL